MPRTPAPGASRRGRLRRHEFCADTEGYDGQIWLRSTYRCLAGITQHKRRDNRLLCPIGMEFRTVLSVCRERERCDFVSKWTSAPPIFLCQPQRTSAASLTSRRPAHLPLAARHTNELSDAGNDLAAEHWCCAECIS